MRDNTFDVMKGIGIIAMIIGHCDVPMIILDFIFAWHMPLFFIISGYFYKPTPIKEYTKKNFTSLVIPYLFTAMTLYFFSLLKDILHNRSDSINSFLGIFVAAGSEGVPMFGDYYVGAIWFLLALFWCRIIFNIINEKSPSQLKGFMIIMIAVLSTYIGTKLFLPTNLLQGMSAMFFFYIGNLFKKRELFHVRPNCFFVIVGIISIIGSLATCDNDYPLSMVRCYYGYYPINVVAACFCSYLLYHIVSFDKNSFTSKILAYFGQISMLILCVHIIDMEYKIIGYLNQIFIHCKGVIYLVIALVWHLFIALFISMLLSKNKFICIIFHINQKKINSDIQMTHL